MSAFGQTDSDALLPNLAPACAGPCRAGLAQGGQGRDEQGRRTRPDRRAQGRQVLLVRGIPLVSNLETKMRITRSNRLGPQERSPARMPRRISDFLQGLLLQIARPGHDLPAPHDRCDQRALLRWRSLPRAGMRLAPLPGGLSLLASSGFAGPKLTVSTLFRSLTGLGSA